MNHTVMTYYAAHKRFTISVLLILFFISFYDLHAREVERSLYGSISATEYLMGKFTPGKHELFTELGRMGIPTMGRTQYLRIETAEALKKMYQAFHQEHPNAPFWVQSSTRNFWDQKRIWENKWNGITKVEGSKLNQSIPNPAERAKKILEFSSMPGTSRHHWGSDLDFNKLFNSYYESGEGKILYEWLQKNAADYGFCQPYTAGRNGGYNEERWHWSYRPLSVRLLKAWNQNFLSGKAPLNGFAGWNVSKKFAHEYVNDINSECL